MDKKTRKGEKMFGIIVNFELKKKIDIKKIGISFRKLKKQEKENILNTIKKIYHNKKTIIDLSKKYTSDETLEASLELNDFSKEEERIIMFCFMLIKRGFKFNTAKQVEKTLDRIVVIDCKKDTLDEFIYNSKVSRIVSELLCLYDIYSKNININEKVRSDYKYILDENNFLTEKDEDYSISIIMSLLAKYKDNNMMIKRVELTEDYLKDLRRFINELSKEETRRFLTAIDMMYSNYDNIQNRIVNYVTIVESILISDEHNIKQNYILKGGFIFKQYLNAENIKSNERIKASLAYTYDIRSAIVHGNEEKILDILNTYKNRVNQIGKLINFSSDKYSTKTNQALVIANILSYLIVRAVIKYWIDNPYKVNYLKNN